MHHVSALVFLVASFLAGTTMAAQALLPWQPHEIVLTAAGEHPWWEFPARAGFERQGGTESLTVEAYWDGGRRWVVRVALPRPGQWKWRTDSGDVGLAGRSGAIEVVAPSPESVAANPNLRGQIRIAPDRRHFEYADGNPFFLLADTLWAGNTARCGLGDHQDGPFFQHLADRQAKGFTAILMQYFHGYGDYPTSPGHRNEGGKPYLDIGTKDLNPAHFQALDLRMRALWDRGFVAAIPATSRSLSANLARNRAPFRLSVFLIDCTFRRVARGTVSANTSQGNVKRQIRRKVSQWRDRGCLVLRVESF